MPASHAKAEGAEVQHLTWLDNESEVHLGYMRPHLTKETEKKRRQENDQLLYDSSDSLSHVFIADQE